VVDLFPQNDLPYDAISENRQYYFDIRLDDEEVPLNWEVRVAENLLERHVIRGKIYFVLDLGFYAGSLPFKVMDKGKVVASANVLVNPVHAKLTIEQYSTMLEDLSAWTKAIYRLVGATIPASAAVGENNRLVTFNLISCYIDLLDTAVHRIADRPVNRYLSEYQEVSLFRAKKVTNSAMLKAFRSSSVRRATSAELKAAPALVAAMGGHLPERIQQRRQSTHSSIYEHRALLGFLNWLDGVCSRLAIALAAEGRKRATLLADVALWRAKIEKMRRRDVFQGIEPDRGLRPTNIFTMKPSYRSAFTIAMKLRRGLGENGLLVSLPIAETPLLYEMWCLGGLLMKVADDFPASHDAIREGLKGVPSKEGIGWVLPQDAGWTIPLGQDIVLNYQLRLSPHSGQYGLRTTVVGAVPDISIVALDGTRQAKSMVILDPKYRTGQSLQDGVRSLHFYRDAIITSQGGKPVVGAAALHPDQFLPSGAALLQNDRPTTVMIRPGGEQVFNEILQASLRALQ
jgi:hypothetical protein